MGISLFPELTWGIRTKVASDLGWRPLQELLEEIHEADPWLRGEWPFQYAGLEPLNKKRRDWKIRYAAAFQLGGVGKFDPVTGCGKEWHAEEAELSPNLGDAGDQAAAL